MTVTEPQTTGQPPDYAERYAALGWRIIPIAPGRKHPHVPAWQTAATDDLDTIRNWYTGLYNGHGVGIVTGHQTGLWVLDVDVADGKPGADTLRALQAEHGKLPATPTARTGTGGLHFLFNWDPARPVTNGDATNLGPGLDIRGEGGQIVAAPTIHPNGEPYSWYEGRSPWDEGLDVADAPDWLYELIHPADVPNVPNVTERSALIPAPSGDSPADWYRNHTTWPELLQLDGWTQHHHTGDDTYWTRPGKATRDGHSAVQHGHDGPLVIFTTECHPDVARLGKPTADRSGISVTKFDYYAATQHHGDTTAAARAIRTTMPTADTRAVQPTATTIEQAPSMDGGGLDTIPDTREHVKAETRAKFLTGGAVLHLPPPDPMIGEWVDRGVIASMPAKFGAGKSFLLLDMALSVASGLPWMGSEIHHTGPAWFVMAEGAYTASDRVKAWAIRNRTNIPDDFMLYPHRFDLTDPATWLGLRWLMEDHITDGTEPPALIVLDTYSQLTSGDEKPETTKAAMNAMYDMRDMTGAAVIIAHHTGHNVSGRGRGDSSLEDNLDVVMPIEGKLRDDNGRPVPAALTNTKQKSRATQPPLWYRLETLDDDQGNELPYVEPTAKPEDDDRTSTRDLMYLLWEFIREYPGQYTARDLSRAEPAGSPAVGTVRTRRDALGLMRSEGCVFVVADGRRELLSAGRHPSEIDAETPVDKGGLEPPF